VIELPHVAVGAAIATKIPNPIIAIPLALASHLVLDRIPHWHPHTYTEIKKKGKLSPPTIAFSLTDNFLALGLGLFVAYQPLPDWRHSLVIIFSCLAAVIPDLIKYPYFLFPWARGGIIKKWVDFERSLQVETKNVFFGLATQAAVVVASLLWIFA